MQKLIAILFLTVAADLYAAEPPNENAASIQKLGAATQTGLVELVKKVEPSVVRITAGSTSGTGVIVRDDGMVLTNYHVAGNQRPNRITVTVHTGHSAEALRIVAADPSRDLLLLQAPPFKNHLEIKIADKKPEKGAAVAAFGNPLGLEFSTSEGIVAGIRTGKDVEKMLGPELYRKAGFSVDATWVQHTAAISEGNSGGPLVNMDGELLGLNTWSPTKGQNLNFAISAEDIRGLLKMPAVKLPLDTTPAAGTTNPWKESTPDEPQVKPIAYLSDPFPSGRVYSPAVFEVERNDLARLSQSKTGTVEIEDGTVVFKHPNRVIHAIAQQVKGKLDGTTIGNYDNGEPKVYATYKMGRRHGVLKTWSEAGDPVLFAQYEDGKKQGFSCFYVDGQLTMLLEFRDNKMRCLRLVDGNYVTEQLESIENLDDESRASQLLAKLEDVESEISTNERKFQKDVVDADYKFRHANAAAEGKMRRAANAQRAAAQKAAWEASIIEFNRRFEKSSRP